jgi:hypothetical protein
MKTLKILAGSILLACATLSFVPLDEWIMVRTANCKIFFPEEPIDQSRTVNTAKGDLKVNIYLYKASPNTKDENIAYILTETEYPDSVMSSDKTDKLEEFFKNSIDGVVNNFHSKLLSQSTTQINGFPGREVKLDLQNGKAIMNIRFYLVKNRMYMLETITNADKDANKSIEKFMNSFEITN